MRDQFQGSLFYTTYKGDAAVEFLNEMNIDAMAVGNHEFDDGPEGLANFIGKATFPIISGNIEVSAEPLLKGKVPGIVILERGSEKSSIVSALANTAAGVNKISAVTHMGLPRDMEIAAAVPGIDVIVGGKEVPIVQAYAYGKFLGELDVTWDDDGNLLKAEGEPILLDASVTPDEGFAARVAELAAPIEELKGKVIGSSEDVIDGDRGSCRAGECQMGNLVADAMLDRVMDQGVQIAIQNGGGLRASIDGGEVTMGEVLTVLPFQNTLSTFQLKGADVVTALENGVSQVEDGAGRFPQVAGLKYSWTRKKDPGAGRVLVVEVMEDGNWVPLDPDKVYGVVSNNYMRGGGDGYKVFAESGMNAYDFGPGLEAVVADYLAARNDYAPYTDGRITEQ
ncbi:unnamed protein product [Effrenium voratum]|uniref:5'-Nucleotidase C-terminal domain-containing protein n=1 Tax=Effrenium voratum TaxID=2562239 RepID=A0AA36MTS5_9DINO|nr:unnamed protein product [Effrenium voratum]